MVAWGTVAFTERHHLGTREGQFDEKIAARTAKEKQTGKKSCGKPQKAPTPEIEDNEQINLTDEESRIMRVSGGGFEQCYNAQAGVDAATMLVVATGLTQEGNDKRQVTSMLQTPLTQAPVQGSATTLIADNGYCSQAGQCKCV